MLWIVTPQSFPGPRPDVHRPALRRVLAFLGFWVAISPSARIAASVRRAGTLHHRIASPEAGKSSGGVRRSPRVGGGEIPRIDGDVAGYGPLSFCGEAAVVLATVKDARRRFAVAFGHH